jgi:hypothetical protein
MLKPKYIFRYIFLALVLLNSFLFIVHAQEGKKLQSRAELTNYEETSRYDDVINFINEIQKQTDLLRVESFGKTNEGRQMPLMIFANPPVTYPREAQMSGKPVVFIMANIHAGEVEGKEAVLHLSRRIVSGDLRSLLDKIIILMAPIYNADGNEKIDVQNRTAQYGPVAGVGRRENAQGLDLNRDYMKLESPEARALVNLFNRWDPHVTVDLHTTNGSYHGYHLTYSQPLNPSIDSRILDYHRNKMLPAITKSMLKQHKYRAYYYGNFSAPAPKPGEKDTRTWQAFDHRPRIGQNYCGFRNRLTILSEAYSYLDFRARVKVTEAFVEEIFKYVAANANEIVQLTKQVDSDAVKNALSGKTPQIGVEYEMKALPKPVDILVGEVTRVRNPRSGKDMLAVVEDKYTAVKMLYYGMFASKRNVQSARAYLFKREEGMRVVLEKLIAHSISVEELTTPLTTEVESFEIASVKKSARPFQGHNEVKLTGKFKKETMTFESGTVIVRTAQPLGLLAAYLLEPESDDGLVNWNFLDAYLGEGKIFPIYKLMTDAKTSSRIVE